ncbi:MAG: hypothetical protein HKN19_11255 [Halioglobus sp.]|nr:hypothetical protein [Halioglobus sp.]
MGNSQQRHLLFVVGMHRSGTSAVCAALEACGVAFGEGLLAPMTWVNDRGFWEAESVVALNEELLRRAGTAWYSVVVDAAGLDFSGSAFDDCRATARELLRADFGGGPVQALKDPRFCLTLPFWLQVCAELGLDHSACSVHRQPLAIARSLEARDGLPLGYGLRLAALYERLAELALPPASPQVNFEQLLESPETVLRPLLQALPLKMDAAALAGAVDAGLRHHGGADAAAASPLEWGNIGSDEFDALLETQFPLLDTLSVLADRYVERGRELTRVGELHTQALAVNAERDDQLAQLREENNRVGRLHSAALATIAEKDKQMAELAALYDEACDNTRRQQAQLTELGDMHSHALAVVAERDEQIRDFDRRLAELGELHSAALSRIEELDRQITHVTAVPVLGRLFGALINRAQR